MIAASWFVALLYFVGGIVAGGILLSWAMSVALHDPVTCLRMFRLFARRFPETFERAWHDENVLRPRDTHPEFAPIVFGTCIHCKLPWVLHGDRLMQHPDINHPIGQNCKGSWTRDYVETE